MLNLYFVLKVIAIIVIVVGIFARSELISRLGWCIILFGILCVSYSHPLIGEGIDHGISVTLIISLAIPFVFLTINVYKFYMALFKRKEINDDE